VTDLDATLNVRMPSAVKAEIAAAADLEATTMSAWALEAFLSKLRHLPRGRRVITVQASRQLVPLSLSPLLCNHPMQIRSEPDQNGDTRCLGCGSMVRKIR
jgi:hypothetical protein